MEIIKQSKEFIEFYNKDVDESLVDEILSLKGLILNEIDVKNAEDIFHFILTN